MGDRFDGALAAGASSSLVSGELLIPTALQSLSLHETLITSDENSSDENKLVIFRAVQNACHGGVMYTSEQVDWHSTPLIDAIKQSQMTSMLCDSSRCSKYAQAIKTVINRRKKEQEHNANEDTHVLDIGTGTGLLAMIAAKNGATRVDAVEMFQPLANLSKRISEDNQLQHIISVHATHSTSLSIQSNQIPKQANILVTEIFDSALLGEACLSAISHAKKYLLTGHNEHNSNSPSIIPAKATMFARVVHSEFFRHFHSLGIDFPLHRSTNGHLCKGGVIPIPVHIDALKEGIDYTYLTDTFEVFEFDFQARAKTDIFKDLKTFKLKKTNNAEPDAIVAWWELDLLGDGSLIYSTSPDAKEDWQDHWLQMVHPLPTGFANNVSSEHISISAIHDDLTVRFALGKFDKEEHVRPACSCGWHALPGGPYRTFELADQNRVNHLSNRIAKAIGKAKRRRPNSTVRCIDISDGAVCSLLAATQVERIQAIASRKTTEGEDYSATTDVSNADKNGHDNVEKPIKTNYCATTSTDMDTPRKTVEVDIVSADDDEVSSFVHSQVARRISSDMISVNAEFEPVYTVVQRELLNSEANNCLLQGNVQLNTYGDTGNEKITPIDKKEVESKDTNENEWEPFDVVLSEPYTRAMHSYPLATLDNLIVLRRVLADVVRMKCISVPNEAKIYAQLIKFKENVVQKAFGRVGIVQGINHRSYDELWENGQDLFKRNSITNISSDTNTNVNNMNSNNNILNDDDENDTPSNKGRRRVSLPLFQYRTIPLSGRTLVQEIRLNEIDEEKLARGRRTRLRASEKDNVNVNDQSNEERNGEMGEADAVVLWVIYDDLAESRVQRYELLILDENERAQVRKTGTLDVISRWNVLSSTWDIDTETDACTSKS